MGGLIFYVSILRLGKEQIIMKRYGYHRTSTRDGCVAVINAEGKLNGMQPNRKNGDDII